MLRRVDENFAVFEQIGQQRCQHVVLPDFAGVKGHKVGVIGLCCTHPLFCIFIFPLPHEVEGNLVGVGVGAVS